MKWKFRIKRLMPASLRFRMDLNDCNAHIRELEKHWPVNQNSADGYDYYCSITEAYQWRKILIRDNYRRLTEALSVPMPDPADPKFWETAESGLTQIKVASLTTAGEHAAIAIIREAKKHKRESVLFWFGIVIGLIGSLTGLVSAIASIAEKAGKVL